MGYDQVNPYGLYVPARVLSCKEGLSVLKSLKVISSLDTNLPFYIFGREIF